MKLKVCGISNTNELETCINNNVDYCGFILNYSKSHRFINFEKANKILKTNKKKSKFVGVLVKPTLKELEKFSKLNIDYFQLYGDYDNNALADIKKKFHKKIITAIRVQDKKDIENYKNIEDSSDIILWDSAGYEKSLSWDYSWISEIKIKGEKMIAGNITKEKLNELSKLADIIDVSGALETNKVKDTNKIIDFVKLVKKIE